MNAKMYYWCPNHGKEGQWVHHIPEECCLKRATTMNMPAASIMATASSAPSSTNSSVHTLQCQVNVTAFNTRKSDLEDDE